MGGGNVRGNETWLSPCLTTNAEFGAVSNAKVAHSVGALGMIRRRIFLEVGRATFRQSQR